MIEKEPSKVISSQKWPDDVVSAHIRGLSGHNARGEEIPDPTPLEIPAGFTRPRSLQEDIAAMMSAAVQQELAERGVETFEEANNFETGEDEEFFSPHEDDVDPEHTLAREAEMRSGHVQEPDFGANKQKLDKLYSDYQSTAKSRRRRSSDEREADGDSPASAVAK